MRSPPRPAPGLADLAALLARAYLRILDYRRTLAVSPSESLRNSLDVSRGESPHVAPKTTPGRAA